MQAFQCPQSVLSSLLARPIPRPVHRFTRSSVALDGAKTAISAANGGMAAIASTIPYSPLLYEPILKHI
jgi:hypothetical protein